MKTSIVQKNQQNFYVETVSKDGAITIVTEKSIPKYLTTSVNINVENVIGRDEDLSKVIQLLAYSKKVVLVNGLGGIGKTTLAKVLFTEQQKHYQHIAWVNVIGDLKEAFVFNTVLLQNLCIDIEDIPRNDDFINHVFEVIINRLQQLKGNNLLVIDNAQEDIGIAQNIDFITLEDNWNVLITSRQYLEGFEIYELGFLEEHHALTLFYLHYHIEKDNELVKQILQAVDFHTLAIEVLAKTGQAKKLSLKNIIKELEAKGLSLTTNAGIKLHYTQQKRIQNIYAFILAAFEIANLSTDEQWILIQFSVLPSLHIHYEENDGENILEFLQITDKQKKDVFTDNINKLVEKGWLNWDNHSDTFKMHNLIQELIREKQEPNTKNCQILLDYFSDVMNDELREDFSIGHEFSKYIPYLSSLEKYLRLSDNLSVAFLYWNLAFIHKQIGQLDKAIDFQKKGVVIIDKIEDEENYFDFYNILASIYQDKGWILKALEVQEKIISIMPNTHPYYAIFLNNLALSYREINDLEKALPAQLEVIELELNSPETEPLDISTSYNNLGLIYRDMGQTKNAVFCFEKAIEIEEENFPNTPTLATTYNNISLVYQDNLEIEICLEYQLKAIKIQEEKLNEYHHNLASSYNNVSITYRLLNQLDISLTFAQKSRNIYLYIEGSNGLGLAYTNISFAMLYSKQEKYDVALKYINETISIRENILSAKALDLADSYHYKASILEWLKKSKEAEYFWKKCNSIYKKWDEIGALRFEIASSKLN